MADESETKEGVKQVVREGAKSFRELLDRADANPAGHALFEVVREKRRTGSVSFSTISEAMFRLFDEAVKEPK